MTFPIWIDLGFIRLHPHAVFEALAYFIGFRVYLFTRSKEKLPIAQGIWVIVGAILGAAIGSKVLYWLEDPMRTIDNWRSYTYLMEGKTIVGGLLGGLIGVEWMKKRVGITRSTGDDMALPIIIGMMIGRIGCFMTGLSDHTYGIPTTWITGVDFGDGIPRHPTQLYEIAFLLLLGGMLYRWKQRAALPDGAIFQLFMAGYLLFRVSIDFIKPTPHPYLGLNNIQLACLVGLLYYFALIYKWLGAVKSLTSKGALTMTTKNRPYIFYELTNSICSKCLHKVEAKVIIEDNQVFLLKYCGQHGREKVLIASDAAYYKKCREFLKPAEMPQQWNTPILYGCPYDCGLCPDHEQHSCLTLLEVTDRCNLQCPICYAESSPHKGSWRSLEQIERMLDAIVRNEGEPDIVQISGGEPTIHPHFFEILDLAKSKPIKHIMVNTNGLRIAQDRNFAKRLAEYMPGFEIYLQFDSFEEEALREIRGVDLRDVRRRALEHLNEFNISTTLVVTLKKGLNDHEIGDIIQFGLKQPAVRGVTFQPIQAAGRLEDFDPAKDRLTLSEVRQGIIDQSGVFRAEDIIPVPCHPDCLAMGYALKLGGEVLPLTGLMDPQILLEGGRNTIVFEQDQTLKSKIFELFSTAHSPSSSALSLKNLLCCLPMVAVPDNISYDNVFRVIIMQFLDPYNFDVRSVKKSCVHIVHPDGRIIPFDTYNMFYRGDQELKLAELRKKYDMRPGGKIDEWIE